MLTALHSNRHMINNPSNCPKFLAQPNLLAMTSSSQGSSEAIMVELRGLEPLTPSLRTRCATSCATAPDGRSTPREPAENDNTQRALSPIAKVAQEPPLAPAERCARAHSDADAASSEASPDGLQGLVLPQTVTVMLSSHTADYRDVASCASRPASAIPSALVGSCCLNPRACLAPSAPHRRAVFCCISPARYSNC
jgi:hypothetical protein